MAKRPTYAEIPRTLNGSYKAPSREIVQSDGTIKKEKLSPIAYHFWAIDPDGNRVSVPCASGRDFPVGVDQGNQVAVVMKLRKRPPKFLPVTECPVRKGYVPAAKDGDEGCAGDDGQGNYGKTINGFRTGDGVTCCPHLKAIAAARKAAKGKKNKQVNDRFDLHQDKVIKELRATTEALSAKVDHERRGKAKSDNSSAGFARKEGDVVG